MRELIFNSIGWMRASVCASVIAIAVLGSPAGAFERDDDDLDASVIASPSLAELADEADHVTRTAFSRYGLRIDNRGLLARVHDYFGHTAWTVLQRSYDDHVAVKRAFDDAIANRDSTAAREQLAALKQVAARLEKNLANYTAASDGGTRELLFVLVLLAACFGTLLVVLVHGRSRHHDMAQTQSALH